MFQGLPVISAPVLVLCYTLATVGMKLVSQDVIPAGAVFLTVGLVVAGLLAVSV